MHIYIAGGLFYNTQTGSSGFLKPKWAQKRPIGGWKRPRNAPLTRRCITQIHFFPKNSKADPLSPFWAHNDHQAQTSPAFYVSKIPLTRGVVIYRPR